MELIASSTTSNLNKETILIQEQTNDQLSPISQSSSSSSANLDSNGPTAASYCICNRKQSDDGEIMIQCEYCEQWFHLPCVNLTTRLIADIETYVCSACQTQDRQIIYKKRRNFHRHDYTDSNASKKPMQAGTQVFVQELLKRTFPDAIENNLVIKLDSGEMLSHEYFDKNGFNKPILVKDKRGLNFTIPSKEEIDLTKIENIVGGDYLLDVIDVERQEVFPMSINELNSYFQTEPRSKIYNLISFEISKTKLTENITEPRIVHEISWVSNGVWPAEAKDLSSSSKEEIVKPEVQKYCLISAGKSYTDFHIDFGGSSVWYHVVKGDKIFYLIEPTEENLKLYENWNCLKNHSEIFLGDRVKNCYKFELNSGDTIFLPTGWIHAVYTPTDSLVFGGNFLQTLNIPLQIKIYEMELRLKTPEKYRFPAFETLQWYAAKYYTQKLKEFNSDRKCIDMKLFNGLKFLNNTLKRWINGKDYYQTHDYEIPKKINCDKLVKIMSKELNKSELLLKSKGLYKSTKNQQQMPSNQNNDSESTLKTNQQKTKQKEVLNYANMNLFEIKLDSNEETAQIQAKDELKLAKPEIKSKNIDELIKKESEDDDDEITKDLKNSFQDSDYIYPSLSKTSKLEDEANLSQNSARKRKLKPHAIHYLQPRKDEPKKKKKLTGLEKMIAKNLKKSDEDQLESNKEEDEDYVNSSEDFDDPDEIDEDNDEDFKLKCKNNLKLSKKLKKNFMNKSKKTASVKLDEQGRVETNEDESNDDLKTTGLAPSAVASKNNTSKQKDKKLKKGFATTKQRLGKLLKLNRVVNI